MNDPCNVCGKSPCYLQCPTQCPFGGDQWAEHCAHEAGAQFDDVRERYAAELTDLEFEAFCDDRVEVWPIERCAVILPPASTTFEDDLPF